MRPVNKGSAPRVYTDYKDAKSDLKKRLGSYCSYCEMNVSNQVDVEHVSPKSKNPDLKLKWENFLLGCKRCNLLKSNNNDDRLGYPFPDEWNTAILFDYSNGLITVKDGLSDKNRILAEAIYNLVELGNRTLRGNSRFDDRFEERKRSYEEAILSLENYKNFLDLLKKSIRDHEKEEKLKNEYVKTFERSLTGFHSLWIQVFEDYPEVKKAILESIPGTALGCYDSVTYEPMEEIGRSKKYKNPKGV